MKNFPFRIKIRTLLPGEEIIYWPLVFFCYLCRLNQEYYLTKMANTIPEALDALQKGEIIIAVDNENRENEGDFFLAGEMVTPDKINFMVTHGRGLLCAPLPQQRCDELGLGKMTEDNTSLLGTPFTMSVDLRGHGCTIGVSAHDRAATIKALVCGDVAPSDFARPGHVFPLYGHPDGVLGRDGHTEALLDLTRLAGLTPGGALIEILNPDGTMARMPQLEEIAAKWELKIVTIDSLAAYLRRQV